jgi:hypothetical protein
MKTRGEAMGMKVVIGDIHKMPGLVILPCDFCPVTFA